jgi:hypothetical protein
LRKELNRTRQRKDPYFWILSTLANQKKEMKLSYDNLLEFIKINHCHYCDDIIQWIAHSTGGKKGKYNLDRKDNSLGYTKENCVVCCSACNYLKGDKFTYDEMLILGSTLKQLREERERKNLSWIKYYEKTSPKRATSLTNSL